MVRPAGFESQASLALALRAAPTDARKRRGIARRPALRACAAFWPARPSAGREWRPLAPPSGLRRGSVAAFLKRVFGASSHSSPSAPSWTASAGSAPAKRSLPRIFLAEIRFHGCPPKPISLCGAAESGRRPEKLETGQKNPDETTRLSRETGRKADASHRCESQVEVNGPG
jgi:hypothetical protein